MAQSSIELIKPRLRRLGGKQCKYLPKSVLYVMSRDCRVRDNHALLTAQVQAAQLKIPLVVGFIVLPKTGYRTFEQYKFMLEGLRGVKADLEKLNITFVLRYGQPDSEIAQLINDCEPAMVVFDFNALRGPRALHRRVATVAPCPVVEVDTHNIVPVWQASDKQEPAARTIRFKIQSLLGKYMILPPKPQLHKHAFKAKISSLSVDSMLGVLKKDLESSGIKPSVEPGERAALNHLKIFLLERFERYAETRNDPTYEHGTSGLSPYLHFGHISAMRVAVEAKAYAAAHSYLQESLEVLLEELIVRKELSDNFCYFNGSYDQLEGAGHWARATLSKHKHDERAIRYTLEQLDAAQTHDSAWNAAQIELLRTGNMHGYMRMYWAKKILEWSPSPEAAIERAIYLNDFYSLDGGDPNGYAGILWSIAGVHDRPWRERDIFGTIRYMNDAGLRRKFDIDAYVSRFL